MRWVLFALALGAAVPVAAQDQSGRIFELDCPGCLRLDGSRPRTGDLVLDGNNLILGTSTGSDAYIFQSGASGIIAHSGVASLTWTSAEMKLFDPLNTGTKLIFSADQATPRGAVCASPGITGDSCAGGNDTIDLDLSVGGTVTTNAGNVNGAALTATSTEKELDFDTGSASEVTSGLIPDGARLKYILTRVIEAESGGACTSVNIGDGTDPDLYALTAATTMGATTDGTDIQAQWANPQLTAGEVTITAVGGNCNNLRVRVVAVYETGTAPTQ